MKVDLIILVKLTSNLSMLYTSLIKKTLKGHMQNVVEKTLPLMMVFNITSQIAKGMKTKNKCLMHRAPEKEVQRVLHLWVCFFKRACVLTDLLMTLKP